MTDLPESKDVLLARAILAKDRPALVIVTCPGKEPGKPPHPPHHVLGKVVLLADGSHTLAVRGWKMRTEDLYEGRPVAPDGQPAVQRDATFPVAATHRGDVLARCRHGTFMIKRAAVSAAIDAARAAGESVTIRASKTFRGPNM